MFGDNYRQQGEYCEFCMMNMDEEDFNHIPECPLNFIQPENYYQILEHQFIDEETNSEDAAYIVGKQIFLAIDAVLAQQKKWAQKSLMSKFDEVLNRYTELTQFVEH